MLPVDALALLAPAATAASGGLIALVCEPFLGKAGKHAVLPWIVALALVIAAVIQGCVPMGHLHGMFALDEARRWLCLAVLAAAAISCGGLQQSLARDKFAGGEPYALLAFATTGVLLMVMAADAVALFVGLELASLPIYALVGMRRHRVESNEALFKYFVLGAIFSGIFLYGIALWYGATGSTHFAAPVIAGREPLRELAVALLAIGLLFKAGAVPFHFWTPDAYTGAPAVVTGFMGAVVKIGAFAALGSLWLSLLATSSGGAGGPVALDAAMTVSSAAFVELERLNKVLLVVGGISIWIGNFSALRQTSARRMLAFSAIAHSGYLLFAFLLPSTGSTVQLTGAWIYLVGYAVANAGALACLAALSGKDDVGDDLEGLAGQGRAHPFHGALATLFLVSIAGIPLTAGFLGKYLVFADLVGRGYLLSAVFAMVMAVIGAAYYLRFVIALWSGSRVEERKLPFKALGVFTLAMAGIAIFALLALPARLQAKAPAAPLVVGVAR